MHTKHINIHYHFIHQTLEDGSITLVSCPTDDMTADILMKALPCWKVTIHSLKFGLCSASGRVLESDTLGEAGVDTDGARGDAGGWIVHSTIAGQPGSSEAVACALVCTRVCS